ncbi:MAG: hypothetical protein IKU30_04665 [Clostridia bacterium]|nr:hypothetical protein [Clostridia bacterium]
MQIFFIVVFVLSSQLVHSVASDQKLGYNPYPFGTTIFCLLQHPILLTMSVYYLGWLWGIVLFLCHLFGIIHMTISWVLDMPVFFIKTEGAMFKYMKLKISFLPVILVTILVFTIVSFFATNFKSLLFLLQNNTTYIIVAVLITIILSVVRLIVANKMNNVE